FGVPEELGWCVAQTNTLRDACHANVVAAFGACYMPSRPPQIIFEPELEAITAKNYATAVEDLGGLVRNLRPHKLFSARRRAFRY
ncbi:hypothetical protein P691DRAFT_676781, partial [Macrolepiota fuliginosa MF-IS2]